MATEVLIPLRYREHPERENGRYQRTVDGLDLGALVASTQHHYGIDGNAVAVLNAAYNYDVLNTSADVDASEEAWHFLEFYAHPSARRLVVAVIAQVSTSRSAPGTVAVTLHETSAAIGAVAPTELDQATGITFTAGIDFDRTQVRERAVLRYAATPVVLPDVLDESPTRMMDYQPVVAGAWPAGHPVRIEARFQCIGARLMWAGVFEMPAETIEGAD